MTAISGNFDGTNALQPLSIVVELCASNKHGVRDCKFVLWVMPYGLRARSQGTTRFTSQPRPSTNGISISSRKDPGGPGVFFLAPMGCNQSNVGSEQQCPTRPYRLMVITARQPVPGESQSLTAPATENDSRRAYVGSRRQVRFLLRRPSERRLQGSKQIPSRASKAARLGRLGDSRVRTSWRL